MWRSIASSCDTYRRLTLENYEKALAGDLLAGVSRSFYLSLKVAPKQTRGTVGLMYLLARATDTIADTEGVEVETRLDFLGRFGELIQNDGAYEDVQTELHSEFCPQQEHEKERELLSRVGECIDWLRAIGKPQAAAIRKVLKTIVHGQRLDLQRFGAGGEVVALATAAELEEYTYLVAGCVGEFWTEVGFLEFGGKFAARPEGEMLELGKRYGQGLQLINILRDLPEDLKDGRCYLPLEEIGSVDAPPEKLMEVASEWRRLCREHFDAGAEYIAAVRNRRMRLAAALALLIGARTLPMLEAADWEALSAEIKVSRKEVKSVLFRALAANVTRRRMGKHCVRALESSARVSPPC